MRHLVRFAGALLVSALVLGCAGDNGFRADEFQGNWTGVQRFLPVFGNPQDAGFLTLNIDSNGFITGQMSRTAQNDVVQVVGSVNKIGDMSLSWEFSDELARTARGEVRENGGQITPTSANGTLQVTNSDGVVGELEFTVQRMLPD